jgi:predicted Zn-dependent protease
MNSVAASVLVGLLVLPVHAQEPSAKGVNFYSLEREVQIGQEAAATLMRTLPTVHEPKVDAYLARLTAELAKYADPRFAYSFTVYEDRKPVGLQGGAPATARGTRVPGAFRMPADALEGRAGEPVAFAGGPILVPLSLLADAPDETAMAFQLAHAMAHVALRHSTKQATRQEMQRLATIPLQEQSASGPAAAAILSSQESAMQLGSLTLARQFELAADTVATGIVAEAGYDPERVVSYLEGQPPADGARPSGVFRAHPTVDRRVEAVRAKMEKLPSREYRAKTGEFDEVKILAASVR